MAQGPQKNETDNASLANNAIRLMTSDPQLKNKIKLDVESGADRVFWYIKFNIPLDGESVNRKTTKVMEPNGYILETELSYDARTRMIKILPIDSFAQDEYYILKITKKVRSSKGQPLGREINILFKLLGGKITEFKILQSTVKLPKPKPRPRNYVPKGSNVKLYSTKENRFEGSESYELPYSPMDINMYIGIAGVLLMFASLFIGFLIVTIICSVVCLAGVAHIFFQLTRPALRSELLYNRGALDFNNEKYQKAKKLFTRACAVNPNNEMAEYALSKTKYYI